MFACYNWKRLVVRRVKCLLGNFNLFRVRSWSSLTLWNSWSSYSFWSHFFNHNLFSKFRVLKYTYECFARTHARILKYWMKIAKKVRSINISRSQNCLLIWIMGLWFFFIKWPFFAAVRFTILLTVYAFRQFTKILRANRNIDRADKKQHLLAHT